MGIVLVPGCRAQSITCRPCLRSYVENGKFLGVPRDHRPRRCKRGRRSVRRATIDTQDGPPGACGLHGQARPRLGRGLFSRSYATPAPPHDLDAIRRGEALFSDSGDLQIIGRNAKVFWTTGEVAVADGRGKREREEGKGGRRKKRPPETAER